MRRYLLAAGIAAAALIPSFAAAEQTCGEQRDARVAGTLAGAGLGALVGGAVAGHDNRGAGAVVGAIGGGIVGNQLSKPNADCAHAYGYYDHDGAWHGNADVRADAAGYYDRDGAWVEGAPNGAYDRDGRWVAGASASDRHGSDVVFESRSNWSGAPADVRSRESWLEQRIRRGMDDGSLSHHDGREALRSLDDIRRQDMGLRHHHGQLDPGDEASIQARLDDLSNSLRWSRQDDRRSY